MGVQPNKRCNGCRRFAVADETLTQGGDYAMEPERIHSARILIVDDELVSVRLLERLLGQAGYTSLHTATDPRAIDALLAEGAPDLLLLDLQMPHLSGFQVLERLRERYGADVDLPVLVLTADVTPAAKRRCLMAGARDFLAKPFDTAEVLLRVSNLIETRLLHLSLRDQNARLEAMVRARTRALEDAQIEILERLGRAAERRDDETGAHICRVGDTSGLIAAALDLPAPEVELIRLAAPLHDVGKIGIADQILLKPGKLEQDEFETMKTHALIGARAAETDEAHTSFSEQIRGHHAIVSLVPRLAQLQ